MASVSSATSGLAYLTQPGGLLSNLPASIPASDLASASPTDLVTLSAAALQAQEVDGLFGIAQPDQSAVQLPELATGVSASNVLPGVSSVDLNSATPQQQYAINNQALLLQQAQKLFTP